MEYFKVTDVQQAKLINNYKNTKYKLLKKQRSNMVHQESVEAVT